MGKKKEGSSVEDKLGCEAVPVTASSDAPGTSAAEMSFRVAPAWRPLYSPVILSLDVGSPGREHDLSSIQQRQFRMGAAAPAASAVIPLFLKGALGSGADSSHGLSRSTGHLD